MMIVVAGPAGSGKSTVFPLALFRIDFFNVDDRCAALNGGSYAGISAEIRARAGAECRAFIEEHITSRTSFAVETTLRTEAALEQATAAMANLPRAITLFDRVECFDNSRTGQRPARVLTFQDGRVTSRFPPLPSWASALDPVTKT